MGAIRNELVGQMSKVKTKGKAYLKALGSTMSQSAIAKAKPSTQIISKKPNNKGGKAK